MEETIGMTADSSILKSSIMNSGAKFTVADDSTDGTYGPGTTGFMAFVKGKDRDFKNVFYLRGVITKRGKSGKDRIDIVEISCPVFDFGAGNKLFRKVMPDEKRKYYVHIEPVPFGENLLKMPDLDFMGWAAAQTQFMHKLSGRAQHFSPWPSNPNNVLNRLFHITDYWAESQKNCREAFASPGARQDIISRLRIMESSLVRCALSYLSKVGEIEYFAAKSLFDGWSSDFKLTTKTELRNTVKVFEKKHAALGNLMAAKMKK
jgi:hypothetical protein